MNWVTTRVTPTVHLHLTPYLLPMDYYLFKIINDFAGQFIWLDIAMIFSASWLIYLLAVAPLLLRDRLKASILTLSSIIVAYGVNLLISLMYLRQRPFVDHPANLLIPQETSKSFPSDHTAISFAIATSIFLINRKAGIAAYIVAVIISFSRIYVGVHYPADIFGGIVVGMLSSMLIYRVYFFSKMHKI
jgi:undecaprenyl-diphosphatase